MKITLQQVITAYETTGLLPDAAHVRVKDGRCCGLGALAVEKGLDTDIAAVTSIIGYQLGVNGQAWGAGFDHGFGNVLFDFEGAASGNWLARTVSGVMIHMGYLLAVLFDFEDDALVALTKPDYMDGYRIGAGVRKHFKDKL